MKNQLNKKTLSLGFSKISLLSLIPTVSPFLATDNFFLFSPCIETTFKFSSDPVFLPVINKESPSLISSEFILISKTKIFL